MSDLKTIYTATTREKAEHALNRLDQKWGKQYPKIIASWRRNWNNLTVMYNYNPLIRRVMYTTNAIEAFHPPIAIGATASDQDQGVVDLGYHTDDRRRQQRS